VCHTVVFNWQGAADKVAQQLNTVHQACSELLDEDTYKNLCMIFGIVRVAGNHMNHGTNRGKAVALSFDTLLKLSNMKGKSGKDTLLHFVVKQVQQLCPQAVAFDESWTSIVPSSEITLKQIDIDLTNLEIELRKVTSEISQGIPLIKNPQIEEALLNRVHQFSIDAQMFMQDLRRSQDSIQKELIETITVFGEVETKVEGEDTNKKFFSMVVEFTNNFKKAVEELEQWRVAQEKEAEKLEAQEAKKQLAAQKQAAANEKKAAAANRSGGGGEKESENIFGNFQKKQNLSEETLVDSMKNKMTQRRQRMIAEEDDDNESDDDDPILNLPVQSQGIPTAKVLYDYTPEPGQTEMLAVKKGTTINILNHSDASWWMAKNNAGKQGWVPSNFVKMN
jgi:hypothetical protein